MLSVLLGGGEESNANSGTAVPQFAPSSVSSGNAQESEDEEPAPVPSTPAVQHFFASKPEVVSLVSGGPLVQEKMQQQQPRPLQHPHRKSSHGSLGSLDTMNPSPISPAAMIGNGHENLMLPPANRPPAAPVVATAWMPPPATLSQNPQLMMAYYASNPTLLYKQGASPETEEKRNRRLERNRMSARKCRRNKKERLTTLESQVNALRVQVDHEMRRVIQEMPYTAECTHLVTQNAYKQLRTMVLPYHAHSLLWFLRQPDEFFAKNEKTSSKQLGEDLYKQLSEDKESPEVQIATTDKRLWSLVCGELLKLSVDQEDKFVALRRQRPVDQNHMDAVRTVYSLSTAVVSLSKAVIQRQAALPLQENQRAALAQYKVLPPSIRTDATTDLSDVCKRLQGIQLK